LTEPFAKGKPVYALLNVRSGWDDGSACKNSLESVMREAEVPLHVEQATAGFDITAAVRRARENGARVVIAGGGDGTLNGVAAGLNGSDVPMAILPIGTLNHLARDLGVSLNVDKAIGELRGDRVARIDLGQVNGRVFINNSVIGLYPAYWFTRERMEHRWKWRWLSIASAMFTVFRRNPYLNLRLLVNGEEIRRKTPYVLIANNEHRMEGYQLGTRDRLDRGLLWVYVMRKLSRWSLFRMAVSLLLGRFKTQDDFEKFAVSSLRVETRRKKLGVSLDGEVKVLRTPLEYRSLPGALRVIAPAAVLLKAPEA
jgi:diacylglycerol kinase family enzyme